MSTVLDHTELNELLRSDFPPEAQAGLIISSVKDELSLHPKACVRVVMPLKHGRDYASLAQGSDRYCELESGALQGVAKHVWDRCAEFSERWIELREDAEAPFAIVVHGGHHPKDLCGAVLARRFDQKTVKITDSLISGGVTPTLMTVHFGRNADDECYRFELAKQAIILGVKMEELEVSTDSTAEQVVTLLERLNQEPSLHGILVQTNRDKKIKAAIGSTLALARDPECRNDVHLGRLMSCDPEEIFGAAPSTALSCLSLMKEAFGGAPRCLQGKYAALINSSDVIGLPLAVLLRNEGATVTLCNRSTADMLPEITRMAHIVVTATGKRGLITAAHLNPEKEPVVIDAAIIRQPDGHIVGDVIADEAVYNAVKRITPVPGGVGKMTCATLLAQVALFAQQAQDAIQAR